MSRIGFFLIACYLVFLLGRLIDIVSLSQGIPLLEFHIPAVALVGAAGFALLAGSLLKPLGHRLGVMTLALTGLFLLSTAFSYRPRGSAHELLEYWAPGFVLFLALAGLTTSLNRIRIVFAVIVVSVVASCALGGFEGVASSGRLENAFTLTGDSNAMAAMLLSLACPFAGYFLFDRRASWLVRVAMGCALGLGLFLMFQTGSRGGLIATVPVVGYLLYRASAVQRVALAGFFAVSLVVALTFSPTSLLSRYQTISASFSAVLSGETAQGPAKSNSTAAPRSRDSDSLAQAQYSAVASASGRWQGMVDGVRLALQNPFFGVGFGNFQYAEHSLAVSEGKRRGNWKSSHSLWTQVVSENGFPTLLLYTAIFVVCWRTLGRVERLTQLDSLPGRRVRAAAATMKLSLIAHVATATFLPSAYEPTFHVMNALTIAIAVVAADLVARERAREQVPATGVAQVTQPVGTLQPAFRTTRSRAQLRPSFR